jgi:hypothetical protein
MLFAKAGWRVSKPRPVQLLGKPIQWVDTARYLGVILDTRMTWSSHIVQVRKKAVQRLGLLSSLLHRRIGLFIRNGVQLYKQLMRPMMDYACPIWRSAACSHLRKLQVIQSKYLRIATGAPWYISSARSARLPLDGFQRNLVLEAFMKLGREIPNLVKIR